MILWTITMCMALSSGHDFANTHSWPAQKWCPKTEIYVRTKSQCEQTIKMCDIPSVASERVTCGCKPVRISRSEVSK